MTARPGDSCACGDRRELHDHHRAGTDCCYCACPAFVRLRWWRPLRVYPVWAMPADSRSTQ